MNPDQTNTRAFGPFPVLAGEDLTGLRSRLVVLTHDTGVPEVKLPAADTDDALFLLHEDGADGELVSVEQLAPGREYRVPLKDAVNPGDRLVLADVGTAADKGKLRKLPAAAGTYRVLAIAGDAGAAGANGKIRAVGPFEVTVA